MALNAPGFGFTFLVNSAAEFKESEKLGEDWDWGFGKAFKALADKIIALLFQFKLRSDERRFCLKRCGWRG